MSENFWLRKNIAGQKFGRLTAIRDIGRTARGDRIWLCRCDCGSEHTTTTRSLRRKKSCGCFKGHGSRGSTTHGMSKTKVFAVWKAMIQRCTNLTDANYHNYGGRGISVCPRWLKFENFYEDMGEPNGLTLERINNDGDYEPENCRWATWAEQRANKRPWNVNRQGQNAD